MNKKYYIMKCLLKKQTWIEIKQKEEKKSTDENPLAEKVIAWVLLHFLFFKSILNFCQKEN